MPIRSSKPRQRDPNRVAVIGDPSSAEAIDGNVQEQSERDLSAAALGRRSGRWYSLPKGQPDPGSSIQTVPVNSVHFPTRSTPRASSSGSGVGARRSLPDRSHAPTTEFRTKTEQVYNHLRQQILAGNLGPGTRLRLVHLAQALHTSTIPVREALRMLSQDKLVVFENHKGATVAELFFKGAAELVASRMWLEIYAARLAMEHHSPTTIRQLNDFLSQMRDAAQRRDGTGFNEFNRQFHTALYAPGTNDVVKRTITELWDQVWRDRSGAVAEVDQGRMGKANTEHLLIMKALKNNSWPQLQAAMSLHMEETVECWKRVAGV